MKTENLVRDTLTEWADEARVPVDLADRALRRRPIRRRYPALAAIAASAALVTGVGLVAAEAPHHRATVPATPGTSDTATHADTTAVPPHRFVAAGRTAMSAYYTTRPVRRFAEYETYKRIWSLYDPATRTYKVTPWAYLDVAPGLRQAAVLEGTLPARRVGVLDMGTGKVVKWIALSRGVAGVAWSPDGRRLVATGYDTSPDVRLPTGKDEGSEPPTPRTGFFVIDAKSGRSTFTPLPAGGTAIGDNPSNRQDLGWSRDGRLLWAPTATVPTKRFYDLSGHPAATPAHEADDAEEAGLSPNGRLIAVGGPNPGPATAVKDVAGGRQVGAQRLEQAVAWADDSHLIGLACVPGKCSGKGEFHNRYVLVDVKGRTTVPLTGYGSNRKWQPLFTRR